MTFWASLISMQDDKQDLHFSDEKTHFSFDNHWKISQSSDGQVLIKNLSSLTLYIDDTLLEINQEKELFGGETLSFDLDKISYVFLPADCQPKNDLKRTREVDPKITQDSAEKLVKVEADLQKEIICSICTETLHRCTTLNPCFHSFCSSCLFDHLKKSSLCPLCRSEAKSVTKNPMLCNLIITVLSNFPAIQRSKKQKTLIREELVGNIVREGKGVYFGSLLGDQKHGKGKFGYSNGDVYEGSWKNNKREGKGLLIMNTGDQYEGSFEKDVFNGKGKYIWRDGMEYEGDVINGLRDGYGTMKLSNGNIYKGDWRNDKKEGRGVFILNNGDKYEGSWVNNSRHGMGKYTWNNGDEYEGNWADNRINGTGALKYSDGKIYRGSWKDDKKEGNGVLTLKNGDKYEGKCVNDVLQSQVKVEYSNGGKYEGEINIDNFKRQGKGMMIFNNGDQYDGNWVNDKQHGDGKYLWKVNKWRYEGLWEEGKSVGDGVMSLEDGTRFKGKWEKLEEGQKEVKEEN